MAKVWANMVLLGTKTLEQVPKKYYDAVVKILEEWGRE